MISFRDPKRDLVPAFSEEKRPRSWLRNRQDDTRGLSSRSAPIRDLVLARPQTPHSRPIIVSSSLFISCSSDLCQQPGREASERITDLSAPRNCSSRSSNLSPLTSRLRSLPRTGPCSWAMVEGRFFALLFLTKPQTRSSVLRHSLITNHQTPLTSEVLLALYYGMTD